MYRNWYTSENRPKFCTKCGLEIVEETLEDGFDAYTGKVFYKKYLTCPTARKSLLHTFHDVWEVIDDIPPLMGMAYN